MSEMCIFVGVYISIVRFDVVLCLSGDMLMLFYDEVGIVSLVVRM